MTIEEEICAAVKLTREYDDRQDYLAALVRGIQNLDDATYERLSDEAYEWFKMGVKSINNKRTIKDFKPAPTNVVTTNIDNSEATGDQGVVEPASAVVVEETSDRVKAAKKQRIAGGKPKPAPKRQKAVPPRELPHLEIDPTPDPEKLELDKWGIMKGTKNAAAADLFERGCRMSDVDASIGGNYYNLLARLAKAGHRVEKAANGVIKVTHKDAI